MKAIAFILIMFMLSDPPTVGYKVTVKEVMSNETIQIETESLDTVSAVFSKYLPTTHILDSLVNSNKYYGVQVYCEKMKVTVKDGKKKYTKLK